MLIPFALLLPNTSKAADYWNVTKLDNPSPGYLKFDWVADDCFRLWDNYGNAPYAVSLTNLRYNPNFKLLKNGNWLMLCYADKSTPFYYLYNQDLQLVDSIPLMTGKYEPDIHDAELLSNGHYLLLYNELVTMDLSKTINGGKPSATVKGCVLVETDIKGNVFWTWKALDHVKVTDVTSDIDLTASVIDLTHANSICEDGLGNIYVSFRHLDEITKINKKTGDVIWRMGGSKCKNNQYTYTNDNVNGFSGFSHQHSLSILENGNFLIFDNGNMKTPQYSRAVEYAVDQSKKTVTKVWEYRYSPDVYMSSMGSAYRLPNGNTLINSGRITEVRPDGTIAFEMKLKENMPDVPDAFYRAYRYVTKMNAVTNTVTANGLYSFDNSKYTTGVSIQVSTLTGSGTATIEKHNYSAPGNVYGNVRCTEILPFRWVLSQGGLKTIKGKIRIKLSTLGTIQYPGKLSIIKRDKEASGNFTELTTTYNSSTGELSADFTGFGEFAVGLNKLGTPVLLSPAYQGADIPVKFDCRWETLKGAVNYQLQISQLPSFSQLTINGIVAGKTDTLLGPVLYNTKYYLRLRGMNSYDTSAWSSVCSFSTAAIPVTVLNHPDNDRAGFLPGDSLTWQAVEGIDSYRLQLSQRSDFSTIYKDISPIGSCSFIPGGLPYNTKLYWRVAAIQGSNTGNWSGARTFNTGMMSPQLQYPPDDTTNMTLKGKMSWGEVAGAAAYQVVISESTDFSSVKLSNKNLSTTSYQYSSLVPYTTYYWKVRACRSTDTSAWSEAFRFRTQPGGPALYYPSDGAVHVALNTLILWNYIPNASSFRLQAATDDGFNSIIKDTAGIESYRCQLNGLPGGVRVFWRIGAVYDNQECVWSETWSFTTVERALLAAPELMSPADNSNNYINGVLSWQPSDGATGYNVQVSRYWDYRTLALDSLPVSNTSCYYHGLQYGRKYYWRVRGLNDGDTSHWSESGVFYTQPDKPELLSPDNEQVQVPTDGQIVWDDSLFADYFHLQLALDTAFSNVILDTVNITGNTLYYRGLTPNTEYSCRIRYYYQGDASNWSKLRTFVTVTVDTVASLPSPVLLSPLEKQRSVPVEGSLIWQTVSGAKTYRAGIAYNSDFDDLFVRQAGIEATEYHYSGLEYNHFYYWRVTAFSDNITGNYSEVRYFLTELEPTSISRPADNAENVPTSGVASWTDVSGGWEYHIQIATDPEFRELSVDENEILDTLTTYILAPGTKYYLRAKAESYWNSSQWSLPVAFTTSSVTGVEDNTESDSIVAYPNPVRDIMFFSGKELAGTRIRVFTPEGTEVINTVLSGNFINVERLAPGCYYMRLDDRFLKFIRL